jgi:hypothetical protein
MLDKNGNVAVCAARIKGKLVSFCNPMDYDTTVDCGEAAVISADVWGRQVFTCEAHRHRLLEEITEEE